MPRIKAVTDANGVKFYPTTITHGVFDTERNLKLTATLDAIYRTLQYLDVYIGAGATLSDITVSANHHDLILKGRPVLVTGTLEYLWVVLPADQDTPAVMLEGIHVPMSLNSTTTIGEDSYKVWKSADAYTGTFEIQMF